MLNDAEIKNLCLKKHLIDKFDKSRLQPCSYDVSLSNVIVRYSGDGEINGMDRSLVNLDHIQFLIGDTGYVLNPGEFILGSTVERVHIPKNIAARFEGKSSLGRIGLATHITAGFIDPGFTGDITLEIKNLNNHPIRIFPGMLIGQLCFFRLNSDVDCPYGSEGLRSHYQNQIGPTPAATL